MLDKKIAKLVQESVEPELTFKYNQAGVTPEEIIEMATEAKYDIAIYSGETIRTFPSKSFKSLPKIGKDWFIYDGNEHVATYSTETAILSSKENIEVVEEGIKEMFKIATKVTPVIKSLYYAAVAGDEDKVMKKLVLLSKNDDNFNKENIIGLFSEIFQTVGIMDQAATNMIQKVFKQFTTSGAPIEENVASDLEKIKDVISNVLGDLGLEDEDEDEDIELDIDDDEDDEEIELEDDEDDEDLDEQANDIIKKAGLKEESIASDLKEIRDVISDTRTDLGLDSDSDNYIEIEDDYALEDEEEFILDDEDSEEIEVELEEESASPLIDGAIDDIDEEFARMGKPSPLEIEGDEFTMDAGKTWEALTYDNLHFTLTHIRTVAEEEVYTGDEDVMTEDDLRPYMDRFNAIGLDKFNYDAADAETLGESEELSNWFKSKSIIQTQEMVDELAAFCDAYGDYQLDNWLVGGAKVDAKAIALSKQIGEGLGEYGINVRVNGDLQDWIANDHTRKNSGVQKFGNASYTVDGINGLVNFDTPNEIVNYLKETYDIQNVSLELEE